MKAQTKTKEEIKLIEERIKEYSEFVLDKINKDLQSAGVGK